MSTNAEITIETADGAMPAYEASPDRAARGAIVVIQEAFGVTPHIQAHRRPAGRRRLVRGGAGASSTGTDRRSWPTTISTR